MAVTKFIVPALSLAASVYAQCSSDETTTISNPSDISSCPTYTGNIVVATGSASGGTVDFGSIEKIDGDFLFKGDNAVQTIRFASLEEVTGDFTYSNLSALSATGLGSLKTVGGALTFEGLGSLGQLGLDAGLDEADSITIINTNIQNFQGIANITDLNELIVSNNLNLGEISLEVEEIGMIQVGPNQQSNGGQTSSFANLRNADTIVIRNSSEVDLGSLRNVTRDLRLIGNTFESFEAPDLTQVGALVVNNNLNLANLSFPELTEVSSGNATLQVANNTKLLEITAFPELTRVTGDVYMYGNFTELELPKIERIQGALDVRTAQSDFDCSTFTSLDAPLGANDCTSNDDTADGSGSGNIDGGSGSSSSSKDAASLLDIPTNFMTIFVTLSSLLSFLM